MIRYLLLGGRWGPVPWNVLVALGVACLAAAALFVLLVPSWSTYLLPGLIEAGGLGGAGVVLLAIGARRRAAGLGKP